MGEETKSENVMIGVAGLLQREINKLSRDHEILRRLMQEQLNDSLKSDQDISAKDALRKVYFDEWEKVNRPHYEKVSLLEKKLADEKEIETRQKDIKDRTAREKRIRKAEEVKKREEARRAEQAREAEKFKKVKNDAIIEKYRQEFHSWSVSSLKDTFVEVVLSPLLNSGQTIPLNDVDGLYAFALRAALHGRNVKHGELNALIVNRESEILERRQLADKLYRQVKAVQDEQIRANKELNKKIQMHNEAVVRAHNEAVDRHQKDVERYNSYVRQHNASLGEQSWGLGLGIGFWF